MSDSTKESPNHPQQPERAKREAAIDKVGYAGFFQRLKHAATGKREPLQPAQGAEPSYETPKKPPRASEEWRDVIGDIARPVSESDGAHTLSEQTESDHGYPPAEVILSSKRVAELNANPPPGALKLRPTGSHGVVITLSQESELIVGREPEQCDIVILDRRCSRRHCAIVQRGNRIVVRDLQSRNGVYINAHKIEGSESAFIGDCIRIGHAKMIVSE